MSKLVETNEKIEWRSSSWSYKKMEHSVVEGYKKIENGVVEGFGKMADKCVEKFFKNMRCKQNFNI